MRVLLNTRALAIATLLFSLPLFAATLSSEQCQWPLEAKLRPITIKTFLFPSLARPLQGMEVLPGNYLVRLREEGHTVRVRTTTGQDPTGMPFLEVVASTSTDPDQLIMRFRVRKTLDRPGAYTIDAFEAEHPVMRPFTAADGVPGWEYVAGTRGVDPGNTINGVPFQPIAYAFGQIEEIVRAAGGNELIVEAVSQYPLARVLIQSRQAKPMTEEGRKLYETLDHYYRYARRSMPLGLPMRHPGDFQYLIDQRIPRAHAAQWNHYRETGRVPPKAQIMKDDAGRVLGIAYYYPEHSFGTAYFIHPLSPDQSLLDWSELNPSVTRLTLSLTPR